MLQSAIFADLQARDVGTSSPFALLIRRPALQKGSFARLTAWGRSLVSRDELQSLNEHLLRDIGVIDQDVA